MADVDLRSSSCCVSLRQESGSRHSHKIRVGVVGVAVGVCELHRFDDRVDVISAVMAHRLEVVPFQDIQRLEQYWPLAAEVLLVDGVASIVDLGRLLDLGIKLCKVSVLNSELFDCRKWIISRAMSPL